VLLLNAVFGIPAWGLVLSRLELGIFDPLWIRLSFSTILLGLLWRSYFVRDPQKFLERVVIFGGWFLVLHTAWIGYLSRLPYSVLCGFLILVGSLLNIFSTKGSSWLLALTTALLGAFVAINDRDWLTSPLLVNVSLWSLIIACLSSNLSRIQQLQSLRRIREKMDLLFQNMKEGLVVIDSEGKLTLVNPAAALIFGLSPEQMHNKSLNSDISFLRDNGRPYSLDERPFEIAQKQKQEVRDAIMGIRRPDGGTVWVKATATPVFDSQSANQHSVLMTFSDISDLRESHQIIFDQQARLEATAKLTALGEMAAGVAHEINNPLAIILGKVFIMEKALETKKIAEPFEVSLAKISETVYRIKRIVKSLQTFAMGGDHDPFQMTSLSDLVKEAVALCHDRIHEKKIQIQLDLEPDLNFECRPIQISQSLINLIYNACDAIEQQPERWIRIWTRSAHQNLVLTITDSGPGIPEEVRKRLMQPFFTTKGPGKGTGLGLSITRGLIHSHLGRIWLDPSAAHTTFVIELPLVQNSEKKTA
jgi:PAS domain S-box-containing protein